jgi:DNA-binding NarL/FixJ family response regulator
LEKAYRRVLLFVAPPGSISGAMTAAIEEEFPWISVENASSPIAACVKFAWDVQLILVDYSLLHAFELNRDRLCRMHPNAAIAVVAAARPDRVAQLIHIIETRTVSGILPDNVNLDIWLSIIRIILKGGEYFPCALLQPLQAREEGGRSVLADQRSHRLEPGEQWGMMMKELTGRELEILAMVARGNQNKIIAADLGLSEHTVKIHIHNIIKKLGVHNRTEATAAYYEHNNNNNRDEAAEQDVNDNADYHAAATHTGNRHSTPSK